MILQVSLPRDPSGRCDGDQLPPLSVPASSPLSSPGYPGMLTDRLPRLRGQQDWRPIQRTLQRARQSRHRVLSKAGCRPPGRRLDAGVHSRSRRPSASPAQDFQPATSASHAGLQRRRWPSAGSSSTRRGGVRFTGFAEGVRDGLGLVGENHVKEGLLHSPTTIFPFGRHGGVGLHRTRSPG